MKCKVKDARAWRDTPEGLASYRAKRAEAQRLANELGYDYGLEANDIFREHHIFMLPAREHRRGFELHCEVVMPENLDRCQPGHGPKVSSS